MLKAKSTLCVKLKNKILSIIDNKSEIQRIISIAKERYDLPISVTSDILTLRVDLESLSDFVLFCVTNIIEEKLVDKWFTEIEIGRYSKEKFKVSRIKMPMSFDMIQIDANQWIGGISSKYLMLLRDAQMIRYNENAQRTLERVINGDKEYYRISLNKNAVNGIMESLSNGSYIPNTITLNMPEDADFYYKEGKLIIRSISAFDILDGYHRYIAMSNLHTTNKDIDCKMELRIVCFPESKARHFIWQEDQKTKMKKIDSDSMNQNDVANQIVDMLNGNAGVLTGMITRNGGVIDSSELSRIISVVYGAKLKKANRSDIVKLKNTIRDYLMYMVDENPDLLDNKWSTRYTICFMVCVANDVDKSDMANKINSLLEDTAHLPIKTMSSSEISRFGKVLSK